MTDAERAEVRREAFKEAFQIIENELKSIIGDRTGPLDPKQAEDRELARAIVHLNRVGAQILPKSKIPGK